MIKLIAKIPDVKILGLTATPPQEIDKEFEHIFSDGSTNIPLPYLVRKGILCPYMDYAIALPSQKGMITDIGNEKEYASLKRQLYDQTIKELEIIHSKKTRKRATNHQYLWLASNLSINTWITIEIIRKELSNLKNHFRGLIVMEQENIPTKYPFNHKGTGGAIGVYNDILKVVEIDQLDPVFVTGKSIVIDEDFTDTFLLESKVWLSKTGLEIDFKMKKTRKGYTIVNGSGTDWNTDTYTRYVTHLFENGVTKLLVGTKYLLGEGWDSQSLNVVVDLTSSSTYSTVNQVKGRALRKNPEYPQKVAHIWEIVPNPSLGTPFGKLYNDFVERHKHYFGIDQYGRIRSGINRLNPQLLNRVTMTDFEDDMKDQLENVKDRSKAFDLWKVGQELGELYIAIRGKIQLKLIQPGENPSKIVSLPEKLQPVLHETINYCAVQLSQVLFDDYRIKITTFDGYNIDPYRELSILLPIGTNFDKINQLLGMLSSDGNKGISLYLRLQINHSLTKEEETSVLIVLPWSTAILDHTDLDKATISSNIFDLDNNTIIKLSENFPTEKQLASKDTLTLIKRNLLQDKLEKSDHYEAGLVRYSGNPKQTTKIDPAAFAYLTLDLDDVILEHQYVLN